MARRLLTLPAALLLALLLALSLGQPSTSAAAFANPVKAQKGADPWITHHDGDYCMVSTSRTDVITIRKSSSTHSGTQNIVAARMSNPYTVSSSSFTTLSTPSYGWERSGAPVNEGPQILQRGGLTFLVH
ncbi:hypothetical protein KBY55_29135 [Streptomyces sp. b94]|uniref:hypothetical protein n=1 Tax=Streptomyces sp. b94 TaxID=1827634 RepID=UPI001B377DD0|nr:hypothetical protein [Streptomyces sp. b94]MBQ1100013.1 hypothetical protein [Streptomyces sp. b94]